MDEMSLTAARGRAKKWVARAFFTIMPWCCALFACQGPASETRVLRVALAHGANHSFTHALLHCDSLLRARSHHRYQLRIYHSSQLGNEKVTQEMLTLGTLDMTLAGLLNHYEPLFSLLEMPYLYRDREHAFAVNSGPVIEELAAPLVKRGIYIIGFYENGFRHLTNSIRPVNEPADLRGLLIRTPENPAYIETIRALGAIPTPMNFSELYTALLQGVVDGQENPLQNVWQSRLHEAQPHLALTGHIYNLGYLLISAKTWESMPPSDRQLLKECLLISTRRQMARMESLDRELQARLQAEGMQFTYPDLAPFETACQEAYEMLYRRLGPPAQKLIERIRQTTGESTMYE
jgi:tripartite ATP-independent transporter DctP family solute receptor